MSRAVIVPFFRPHPRSNQWYRMMEKFFHRHFQLWQNEVDAVYIMDAGWDFDMSAFGSKGRKLTMHDTGSHWENMNNSIPQVIEDYWLMWDCDTLIYRAGVVDSVFQKLESGENDIVGVLDGSGFLEIDIKFPYFAPNEYRSARQRFCPYFFAVNNNFFKKIGSFDFTPAPQPRSSDSMGTVTEQLLSLSPRIHELPDDRSSIYYDAEGITTSANLDSPNFLWSQECPKDYGYHHIRNWGLGLLLATSKMDCRADYWDHLKAIPKRELSRSLGWEWHMTEDPLLKEIILEIMNDNGFAKDKVLDYFEQFKQFHSFLENF